MRVALACVLLLPLAACDGGGGADPVVHPDDLQMTIVRGGGQRTSVRPFGEQPADSLIVHTPVVARISLATDLEEEDGVTGPSRGVRLPPVTVHWRTLDPFCQVVHAATQVEAGSDTTVNRYVRPTRSGICRVVAQATAEGRPLGGPDTAAIHFDPGPPVRMEVIPIRLMEPAGVDLPSFTSTLWDAHGNAVSVPGRTYELTGGAPLFFFQQHFLQWIHASGEGYGEVTVRHGALSGRVPVWSMVNLGKSLWRLSWECYGLDRPDGARVDSVHFGMDTAHVSHGAFTPRGVMLTLSGTLVRREWVRGQPVHETRTRGANVFAARKPRVVEWSPGEPVTETAGGFVGGTLCQPDPGGAAWSRTAPVRFLRRPEAPQ